MLALAKLHAYVHACWYAFDGGCSVGTLISSECQQSQTLLDDSTPQAGVAVLPEWSRWCMSAAEGLKTVNHNLGGGGGGAHV
jgi:hypothetical protein